MLPRWHTAFVFLLLLSLASWHIDHGRNDSTVSRAAMVAAIVDHGTLCIDPYQTLTGDKSLVNGHYYSDKAPLPALLVVPAYWTIEQLGLYDPTGRDLLDGPLIMLGGSLCASLPFAWMVTLTWSRLRSLKAAWRPALTASLAFVGSFLFAYTGNFNAHLLSAFLMMLALHAWEKDRPLLCGFFSGAAVSCEYTLILFPLFWSAQALFAPKPRRIPILMRMALGGIPWVVLMACYNSALTGDPFSIGYQHEADYTFMNEGFGITAPRTEALWGLTFSTYRGMFVHAPVVLLVLLAWTMRKPGLRAILRAPVVLPALLLFLLISSYAMWWGGWAFGPRHLIAPVALLLYRGLRLLSAHRRARLAFFPLVAIGLVITFSALSTVGSSFPTETKEPLFGWLWPNLIAGHWSEAQVPIRFGATPAAAALAFPLFSFAVFFLLHRIDRRSLAA